MYHHETIHEAANPETGNNNFMQLAYGERGSHSRRACEHVFRASEAALNEARKRGPQSKPTA